MKNSIEEKEAMTSFIEKILVSFLMLAIGILYSFRITGAVSITIGVILCVYGAINIIIIGVSRRPLISVMGILNAVILSIGTAFCVLDLATIVSRMIPYILATAGFLMFIDSFYSYFLLKNKNVVRFVTYLIMGAASGSLGESLLIVHEFRVSFGEIIFGIILSVGAFTLLGFTIAGRVKRTKAQKEEAQSEETAE